jgi:hypothetical protein
MLSRVADVTSLGEIDVVDRTTCDRVAKDVLELRPFWTKRSPNSAFFTLGVNAYMDLAQSTDPRKSYYRRAAESNAILAHRFADLHQALAATLHEAVGIPARYAPDLAMPGFHIWTEPGIPRTASASIHFDLQYQRLLAIPRYANATGTVSFTLPVRLPSRGSSLLVWPDFTYPDDVARLPSARSTPPTHIDYRLGRAIVHSGHVLHQIGPTPEVLPGDLRMTLQGHGIVVDHELILYW